MSSISEKLRKEIIELIAEHYRGVPIELDGLVSVRDYSEIFRVRIESSSPITLALKRCFVTQTKIPDSSAAEDQYFALKRVKKAIAERGGEYRIPEPLFINADQGIYAMSWVEGQSITQKLHRFNAFWDGPDWFESAGAWLGSFHNAGPLRADEFDFEERIKSVANLLEHPLSDQVFVRASRTLSQGVSAMRNLPVQVSWLHGDCKTDNFLIGEKEIFGIDISLIYENAVEYDIAQFLNHLELLFSSPQNLHLRGMKSGFETAFLQGYRRTGPGISPTCLNWVRLWSALTLWRNMLVTRHNTIGTWLLNKMFSRLASRLAEN